MGECRRNHTVIPTERAGSLDRMIFAINAVGRELYDHDSDPSETLNIAARPGNAELVAILAQRLADGLRLPSKTG